VRLNSYLDEQILNRPVLTRGPKRKSPGDNEPHEPEESEESNEIKKVGLSTANMVVSAMVALYKFQKLTQDNNNPHPRGLVIKMKLENLKKEIDARKFNNFTDRGQGTAESVPPVLFI
jgi:hypothetical protein